MLSAELSRRGDHQGTFSAASVSFSDATRSAAFARVMLCSITCVWRLKEFTDDGVGQHSILVKSYIDFLARSLFKYAQPTMSKELKDLPQQFKTFQNKMSTESAANAKCKEDLRRLEDRVATLIRKNDLKK